jgi:cobaltochelatase CobN
MTLAELCRVDGIAFDPKKKSATDFAVELPVHCTALQSTPVAQRKIALVLTYDLSADAGAAKDAMAILNALQAAGYAITAVPDDGKSLMRSLLAQSDAEERFARSDYAVAFAQLPRVLQDSVTARWGAPEQDASFREGKLDCGAFALRVVRYGAATVALRPLSADLNATIPSHGQIAFYHWLADGLRAHAIISIGASCA